MTPRRFVILAEAKNLVRRFPWITRWILTVLLLSAAQASIQPQQRQHFVNKSSHLLKLILGGKSQHRRSDAHVDPFLNQSCAVFRRSVRKPDLDQAFRRIGGAVIMIEVVLRLSVG